MRKTLLLVFIHGFKGGDDTFGSFPEHLRALVSHALPRVDVTAIAYPRFETRGELKDCVARFREWLENKVIDLEVKHATPSPTVEPSVHVVLVGHSMGGIVAAETAMLLASEQPILPPSSKMNPEAPNFPSNTTLGSTTGTSHPTPGEKTTRGHRHKPSRPIMFPHVQGILAFDTPFLGLAPGMVAHSIEGGRKIASSAYGTFAEISSALGWGLKDGSTTPNVTEDAPKVRPALPAPSTGDAAAAPKWQSWGKYAMFAGAAGAVAAGGAAALYTQREKLSAGWNWAGGHLLFVGCLARPEDLRKRVAKIDELCQERGIGGANLYTNLGNGAKEGYGITSGVLGKERTFCNLPAAIAEGKNEARKKDVPRLNWHKAVNDKAKDETSAHVSMFIPKDNPGFYNLGEDAKDLVASWVDHSWYESSDEHNNGRNGIGATLGELGDGWEHPDYASADVKAKQKAKEKSDWDDFETMNTVDDANEAHDDDDEDVKMRDLDDATENLEGSVIVDRAGKGTIPLPSSAA